MSEQQQVKALRIYTASRVRHSDRWVLARAAGFPVCATWINEAGPGQTEDMGELWQRCIAESSGADALILYRQDGEPLKGALVEAGAALGAGRPVFAVGFDGEDDLRTFSFLNHPLVKRCAGLEEAFTLAGAVTRESVPADEEYAQSAYVGDAFRGYYADAAQEGPQKA